MYTFSGSCIGIRIFGTHRNPRVWANPEVCVFTDVKFNAQLFMLCIDAGVLLWACEIIVSFRAQYYVVQQ